MPPTPSSPSTAVRAAAISAGPVALAVNDLAVVAAFYRTALGLVERADDGVTVRLGTPDRDLVVLHHAPDARPDSRAAGLFHVAILYASRTGLADAIVRVLDAGVRLDGASDHLVSEAVYLHDPEGNGIELYRDRDRDAWDVDADGRVAIATLPLDLADLLRSASAAPSAAVPADATVGHVHLQVADIARSRAFYSGVLGFDVMADDYPDALFVATGGYHHHVGLNVWRSARRPAVPGSRGLRHATLLLADDGVRRRTLDALRTAGVVATEHADGSFTVADPSGVALRLALA